MPISVQCDNCRRSYNLDDKLAGKTVKCKNCGTLIRVPAAAAPTDAEDCLACGKPMPIGARICTACGFNRTTGQREMTFLDAQIAENNTAQYKRKAWVRQPGSHLLESIDHLIMILCLLALLAGVALTIVHIVRSPLGFSFQTLLPTLAVLGMFAGIIAPLATLAVNGTLRAMKIPPREDTYSRLLTCSMLPFIFGLLAGWPDLADTWGWVVYVGWVLAIGLLIYFFRSKPLEWGVSLSVAALAILLSLIFVNIADALLVAANGPLNGDMLPSGPWTALATGHSPKPEAVPAGGLTFTPIPTPPEPPRVAGGSVGPTTPVTPTPQPATPPTMQAVTPAPTPVAPVTPPDSAVAINVTPRVAATESAPVDTRPGRAVGPAVLASPFFAKIVESPDFAGIQDVVVPTGAMETMLTVKVSETSMDVQRWTINPLEKKERINGVSFYAKKPALFALSPKGDTVVNLAFFPRRELDISYFDNKTAKKIIPISTTSLPADTVASFPGYLDASRVCIRWDYKNSTILQVVAALTGSEVRHMNVDVTVPEAPAVVISPNGKIMVIYGTSPRSPSPRDPRNQIIVLNTDNYNLQGRISVSDLPVRFLGMAISPDNTQVAVYAAVSDLPTILIFKLSNGEMLSQSLLSQSPMPRNAEFSPHPLLWVPGCQSLLLNGTTLVSPATGKKIASLDFTGMVDQQIIGANTIAYIIRNADGTTRLALAEFDNAKIQAAARNAP
jgi:predicted Zn finger-like uncharacterized protein